MSWDDINLEDVGEEVLGFLKGELGDAWDHLEATQKDEVVQMTKDLAKLMVKSIADPAKAAQYAEDAAFIKSSLASRAWMVEMEMAERLRAAALGALKKLVGVVLAVI